MEMGVQEMDDLLITIFRTFLAFFLIMIITRILGKRTISQITYHDFVAAITLGSMTASLALNISLKTENLVASLLTFTGIVLILSYIALKNRPTRKLISGQPTVLIQEGKLLEYNFKKLRLTLDTLNQELREKDIFDIHEVDYAVMELNGVVSVLLKPEYQKVRRKDLNLPTTGKSSFPVELIMDGTVIEDNLQQNRLSSEWLDQELLKRGTKLEQVFYAVRSTDGTIFFDLYHDHIQHPIDQE